MERGGNRRREIGGGETGEIGGVKHEKSWGAGEIGRLG